MVALGAAGDALLLQAAGIALPRPRPAAWPRLIGAVLFGATFIGVSTMALAAGRLLASPGAVALLTAGYSVGQIAGPVTVTPLLHHGFSPALLVAAAGRAGRRPSSRAADADPSAEATTPQRRAVRTLQHHAVNCAAITACDHRVVLAAAPHQ